MLEYLQKNKNYRNYTLKNSIKKLYFCAFKFRKEWQRIRKEEKKRIKK